jgi:hypothetical protein
MTARTYTDRDGNEKTAWTKIGTLWPLKDREGFSLSFDALPLPSMKDGRMEVRAVCFPPKEKEEPQQRGGSRPPARDLDDQIPFLPER